MAFNFLGRFNGGGFGGPDSELGGGGFGGSQFGGGFGNLFGNSPFSGNSPFTGNAPFSGGENPFLNFNRPVKPVNQPAPVTPPGNVGGQIANPFYQPHTPGMMRTADFQDRDNNGIDDRDQQFIPNQGYWDQFGNQLPVSIGGINQPQNIPGSFGGQTPFGSPTNILSNIGGFRRL